MYIYLLLIPVIFIGGLLLARKFSDFLSIRSTDERISVIVAVGVAAVLWPLALPLALIGAIFLSIIWIGLKILGDKNAN
jgi:hypothetical protein